MSQKLLFILALILIPSLMFAHGGHGHGVMAGLTHPILGVDHHVAILATGFLGYLLNQSKWFLAPIAFIAAMIVGGFLGVGNEATFLIEKIIALSVFVIGLMIAYRKRQNVILVFILLALFGFFHGFAHGAEMDPENTVFKYIPGYAMGAILLACLGAFIAKLLSNRLMNDSYATMASGIVIGCGIMMLLP